MAMATATITTVVSGYYGIYKLHNWWARSWGNLDHLKSAKRIKVSFMYILVLYLFIKISFMSIVELYLFIKISFMSTVVLYLYCNSVPQTFEAHQGTI